MLVAFTTEKNHDSGKQALLVFKKDTQNQHDKCYLNKFILLVGSFSSEGGDMNHKINTKAQKNFLSVHKHFRFNYETFIR